MGTSKALLPFGDETRQAISFSTVASMCQGWSKVEKSNGRTRTRESHEHG
jgi:hypothetical protein